MTDYAQLAQSLKDNEAFERALASIKADALDRLSTIEADDLKGIIRQQAIVAVVDSIRENIEDFIREGSPKSPRVIP